MFDYGARGYYPATGRFTTMDPLAEKRPWESPYVYCGNNPVNRVDPDGMDYIININRDKDGNIVGITFSATVYITGDGANQERADELNKLAAQTFKTKVVNGVNVGFNVVYKYDKEITKVGDFGSKIPYNSGMNILELSNNSGRSFVKTENEGTSPYHGTIYKSKNNIPDYDVMHETMHFMGFRDRYTNTDKGSVPDDGYKNDIMGVYGNFNINTSHYETIYRNVVTRDEIMKGKDNYPYQKYLSDFYTMLRIPNPRRAPSVYPRDRMLKE